MTIKAKSSKPHRIYVKSIKQWVEVSEEVYTDYMRECDATCHKMQYHGRCARPRKLYWLCDADCITCEFRRSGDVLSLDAEMDGEEGTLAMIDTLADEAPSVEDIVTDLDELSQLLHRLTEAMPEAIKAGILREQGLSESDIAAELGIPRTTLRSRLAKVRKQLKPEFPDVL